MNYHTHWVDRDSGFLSAKLKYEMVIFLLHQSITNSGSMLAWFGKKHNFLKYKKCYLCMERL